MAIGEVSSSSFEFHEGLRVLVPGAFGVGVYEAIAATFGFEGTSGQGTLGAVLAALVLGFILLFLDLPTRAAVFSYNAPVAFMQSWKDVRPPGRASYLNVYYAILDSEVPAGIRNRTYYQGAIYRIGFEGIYFAASAVGVLAVALLFPSAGTVATESSSALRWMFAFGALAHILVVLGALWSRYARHRGNSASPPAASKGPWRSFGAELGVEIPLLDQVLLAASAVSLVLGLILGVRWCELVAVATPGALWAARYFGGVPARPPSTTRRNLHAASAAVSYGLSGVFLCVIGAVRLPSVSPLDAKVTAGWIGVTLIASLLIVARGHERKLLGSYGSQRTWLERHRETLIKKGLLVRASGSSPDAASSK